MLWLSQHYKPIIRQKLPQVVAKATDSLYKITFDDINISLTQKTVTATNVHFFPDSNVARNLKAQHRLPSTLLDIRVPAFDVTGIAWGDAIAKDVQCETLQLNHPDIIVTVLPKDSLKTKDTAQKARVDKISIQQILFKNGSVTYKNATDKDTEKVDLRGVNATLNNWEFVPGKEEDTSRIFFAANATVSVDTVRFRQPNALYTMKVGAVSFDSKARSATIKDFAVIPAVSKEEFYRRVGRQLDMITLHFSLIKLEDLAWPKLMYDGILKADLVTIDKMDFSDYLSRFPPFNNITKLGNYPQQVLMRTKLPIDIRRLQATHCNVKYTELDKRTNMEGVVDFSNVSGTITNITNMPELIKKDAHCIIKMQGTFLGKSPASATFNLTIPDKKGAFAVDIIASNIDAPQLTPILKALALAEMKSVHISKLTAHVQGNEEAASAHATVLYNDLKIELEKVTDKETDDGDKLKDRHILSFLANKLILYPNNPMDGKEVRTADNQMQRDQYKSFFALIWKNILACTIKTVVRNDALASKFAKKQEKGAQTDDGTKNKGIINKTLGGKYKGKDKDASGAPKPDKHKKK